MTDTCRPKVTSTCYPAGFIDSPPDYSCGEQGRAAVVVGVDPAAVHQRITDHLRDQHGHDEPNATTVVLRPDGTRWGQQP